MFTEQIHLCFQLGNGHDEGNFPLPDPVQLMPSGDTPVPHFVRVACGERFTGA